MRVLRTFARAPRAMAALRARYGPGTVNFNAARRLAFFPALGIGLNRVKKNANSALILLLHEMESGRTGSASAVKDDTPRLLDLPRAELDRFDRYKLVVSIRNPYSRVLSAFLDKFRFDTYRRKHGAFALTPDGFEQFVTYLENGGLRRDGHWDLQTRLIALPLSAYDHVLRFESLRDDALAMFEARGLTVPDDALKGESKGDTGKETGADRQIAQFYTLDLAARIAHLFADDFKALGYSPVFPHALEPPPQGCCPVDADAVRVDRRPATA